tara:strand:- start:1193 stop:2323 length:1131 start_codon:yes stop_codon:yes gene_type:complete
MIGLRPMNKIKVPYLDLKSQYLSIKNQVDKKVLKTLESTNYVLGPDVENFEKNFAKYCDTKYAIGVNSGTSALHLSLLAANIGQGDEVITVSMTFIATAMAISYTGAIPIFVDIESESLLMDHRLIENKISSRTKAIIVVHLYGQCANLNKIRKIANKYNLILIEDASQAHGSKFINKKAGSVGDIGTFSFYPGKNLGAYGEAGCVVTNNFKYSEKIRKLRNWSQERKNFHDQISFNYRMDGLQGAILNIKLKKIDLWTKKRRIIANNYNKFISNKIKKCKELNNRHHVFHIYSIFSDDRDSLQKFLYSKGIQTGNHYPIPCHLQKPYKKLGYKMGDFPISEKIANTQISLPIYPELSIVNVKYISKNINKWINSN